MIDCLTDGTPVHMILPQFPESSPEDVVLRIAFLGVGGDDGLGCVAGDGEDLTIAGKVGDFEVEGHT